MDIIITVYKESGKYYTSERVQSEKNYELFDPEFKRFVRKHLPARCQHGFVTVQDAPSGEGFHNTHYMCDELVG